MKTVSCLALLFFLIACGKKKECPEESLIPAYIGYTDDQLDTLVIRRYDPGNSFTHLVDSTRFTLTNTTRLRIGDTVLVHIPDGIYHFNGQYDWQFNNPFDSVNTSVSDMKFDKMEEKSGGVFGKSSPDCYSTLSSYKRNNVLVGSLPSGSKYLYIRK